MPQTRLLAVAAVLISAAVTLAPAVADAAAAPPRFANCTAMHSYRNGVYKGGIAKPGAKDKRKGGGHAKYKPYVNAAYYQANVKMDADHDGIACEQ